MLFSESRSGAKVGDCTSTSLPSRPSEPYGGSKKGSALDDGYKGTLSSSPQCCRVRRPLPRLPRGGLSNLPPLACAGCRYYYR